MSLDISVIYDTNIAEKVNTVEEAVFVYEALFLEFNTTPDSEKFSYPTDNTVFDEEQSVRWNREKAKALQESYDAERFRLKDLRTANINAIHNKILELLSVDFGITKQEAERIWTYAYDEDHSYGVHTVVSTFIGLVEMYTDLLKIHIESK